MGKTGRVTTQPLRPYMRLPEQSAAPIAAASTTNAAVIYTDGTSLLLSIDGGAYATVITGGSGGSTFTGPVTIDTSTAPALSIDTDAVSGTLARIRHDVATTPTGALIALSIDLTTNWTAGNVAHTGVTIAIPATTAAAAAGVAALAINSDATLARVVDIDVANTGGTLVLLRYGAAATLAAALVGLSIGLTTNVTHGSQQITGVSVAIAATDVAAAAGVAAIAINSDATLQRVIDVDVANTSGTLALIRWGAATTLATAATVMLSLDGTTNTTPGSVGFTGLSIAIPADTAAAAAGRGAIAINSDATLARVLDIDVANTSGTLAIVRYGAAVTLTATALIGLDINLATNVTAATNDPPITGIAIRIPATDAAAAAGEAALYITSDATAARSIDVDVANTSGTIAYIRYGAGTTLAGALTGINIDLTTNVSGVQTVACIYASTSPAGSSASYCATFDFRGTAGTAAGNGIVNVEVGGATTITGQLVGIECDLSTNVTPGANACIGQRILIPATTRAAAANEAALVISSDATAMYTIFVDVALTTTSNVIQIQWGAATTLGTATITCINIDASTNLTLNNQTVRGIAFTIGAGASSSSSCIRCDWRGTAGTAAGNGIIQMLVASPTTLTGQLVGIECDLSTNVTPGANAVIGQRILIPATTRAAADNEAALVISSNATAMYTVFIDVALTTTSNVIQIQWGAATTLGTATINCINIDMSTNLTLNNQTVRGFAFTLGAGASSSSVCIRCDWRGTAGTAAGVGIIHILVGSPTTLTGQLVGIECDLSTNVTPGANAVIGQRILIPATTRANTAGEGALVIASDATAARSIDIDIANTSGTPFIMRYGATTELNAVVMATLDMSTNVTTNTSANVGLDVIMLAADRMTSAPLRINGMRIFVNAGIPIDANGSNGDVYFDTAGDKDAFRPTIYQRQSAVWVSIA